MAKFAYNNAKNANICHTPFKLNCDYHLYVSYKEDLYPRSKSKAADELAGKLIELMTSCQENLHHAQELQKRAKDKSVKPKSYTLGDKVLVEKQIY